MQKCIDKANPKQKDFLISKIASLTRDFVRNPFGNYVIQYVLDLKDNSINKKIYHQIKGDILDLGKQKFSSNVIEKCLEFNDEDIKEQMVNEILTADHFIDFLLDQYGNYVI